MISRKNIFIGILITAAATIIGSSSVHATTFTVTNTNPNGAGSLYQAMLDANANPDHDTINFNIPGAGPHTIYYAHKGSLANPEQVTGLPTITTPMTIDACTQPGSDCNATSLRPMVELSGQYTAPGNFGVYFQLNAKRSAYTR